MLNMLEFKKCNEFLNELVKSSVFSTAYKHVNGPKTHPANYFYIDSYKVEKDDIMNGVRIGRCYYDGGFIDSLVVPIDIIASQNRNVVYDYIVEKIKEIKRNKG